MKNKASSLYEKRNGHPRYDDHSIVFGELPFFYNSFEELSADSEFKWKVIFRPGFKPLIELDLINGISPESTARRLPTHDVFMIQSF